MKVAVVGGGVFGSMAALELARRGHLVKLHERNPRLMRGASYNNQNRLHLGFHYPRDDETAHQCQSGFSRFLAEFQPCVVGGFRNVYCIAREGSRTSPGEFLRFCERHRLACQPVDLEQFRPRLRGVSLGVETGEVVYDASLLCGLIGERLERSGVEVLAGSPVVSIRRRGREFELGLAGGARGRYDGVVNCTYASVNDLTAQLGHRVETRAYEYTAVAIVELDWPVTTGITILDGPFMTVLPFGRTGQYLLYDVERVVIAREEGTQLNAAWLDARTSPFAGVDQEAWFAGLCERAGEFVPDLRGARLRGILQGPRVVLAGRDDTDARPSIVTAHEPGYASVFSGKIDHCLRVAEEVAETLFSPHGLPRQARPPPGPEPLLSRSTSAYSATAAVPPPALGDARRRPSG